MTGHQEIWCQPGDAPKRQFIVFFDDPSQDIATFDDEDEARAFWEKASIDWNCYLLGTLPRAREKPVEEPCPDCGRPKAKNAGDAARGLCPKWWAIRDEMAAKDCDAHAAIPRGTDE